MKKREGEEARRGSTLVEAALLFPLIILMVIAGCSLMFSWYDEWDHGLEVHRERVKEEPLQGNHQIIQWKQWKELWAGDAEENRGDEIQ